MMQTHQRRKSSFNYRHQTVQTSAPSGHVKQLGEAADIFLAFLKRNLQVGEPGRKVNGGRGETPSETPPAAETAPPISKKKKRKKKK
jgi:hypothetical protein